MLVSAIHHHEAARGIHMFSSSWTSLLPPIPSHPSRLSHSTRLSSLSQTANSHWLSILYMVVYMFPPYSLKSSHPLLPPLPQAHPQICSLCQLLHSKHIHKSVLCVSFSIPGRRILNQWTSREVPPLAFLNTT